MALESAAYLNGLVSSNPASTDPSSQGDDHIRLIKSALLATFPALVGPVTASDAQLNAAALVGSRVVYLATSAGTVNAYTATASPVAAALADGAIYLVSPHVTNTAPATLNVSSIGVKPVLRRTGDPLVAGDLIAGVLYQLTYRASLDAFHILTDAPLAIPLAVTQGGTGAITAPAARTALGLTDASIGSATGLTSGTLPDARLSANVRLGTVAVANGGTGGTDSGTARVNLGMTYWFDRDASVSDIRGNAISNWKAPVPTTITANRALSGTDSGAVLYVTAASAINITIPAGLGAGFGCTVIQAGTGQITFVGSGVTPRNRLGFLKTAGQYAVAGVVSPFLNEVMVTGDLAA